MYRFYICNVLHYCILKNTHQYLCSHTITNIAIRFGTYYIIVIYHPPQMSFLFPLEYLVNIFGIASWNCLSLKGENRLAVSFTEEVPCLTWVVFLWQFGSIFTSFSCLLLQTCDKTQHRVVVRHASDSCAKMSCGCWAMYGNCVSDTPASRNISLLSHAIMLI